MQTITPPDSTQVDKFGRSFRSAIDGKWYSEAKKALEIDAVCLKGEILMREANESDMPWIRRCAAWANNIFAETGLYIKILVGRLLLSFILCFLSLPV